MEAECQCGRVHFEIPHTKPLSMAVCHCDICKKITSAPYYVAAIYPYFEIPNEAKEHLKMIVHQNHDKHEGHFCTSCGNRIFNCSSEEKNWISISAGIIKGFDWNLMNDKDLTLHIFTDEAVTPIPSGHKTTPRQPDPERSVEDYKVKA